MRDVLGQWDHTPVADVVALLTSELVTNAILHAGSDVDLTLCSDGDRVRVEVADRSRWIPRPAACGADAQTGRGLAVVAAQASDWGARHTSGGKVVWFEVSRTDVHDIALVDVPVARFLQMQEQHDAMRREFALIAAGAERLPPSRSRRVVGLADQMQARSGAADRPFHEAIAAAAARGDVITTLQMRIPLSALRAYEDFLLLFEEGDEYCRKGELLTPPSPPEVVEFRRWFVAELIRQIRDGATPKPFWAGRSQKGHI